MTVQIDLPPKRDLQEILANDQNILRIRDRLQKTFAPNHIFLFGSRAFGTHRADSDYDLVVVVEETNKTRFENMDLARVALFDLDVTADVFVYSQKHFNEWKNELNSIPEAAFHLGVELPLA